MTTEIFCFYLQNRLIQTSQTGGQQYSDTSPFSIPCSKVFIHKEKVWFRDKLKQAFTKVVTVEVEFTNEFQLQGFIEKPHNIKKGFIMVATARHELPFVV